MTDEFGRLEDMRRAIGGTAKRYPHLSIRAISRLFRCWPSEAAAVLEYLGIERPETNDGDKLTPENVRADVAAGLKLEAIIRKYNAVPNEIRRVIIPNIPREISPASGAEEEKGVSFIERSRRRIDPVAVARARAEGLIWSEIERRLNLGQNTATYIAKREGFTGGPEIARQWLINHGHVVQEEESQPVADEAVQTSNTNPGPSDTDAVTPMPQPAGSAPAQPPRPCPVRSIDEIRADLKRECDEIQHKARGILPKGLTDRQSDPPLGYLNEQSCPGKDARAQIVALAFAMLDDRYYDVELIVRKVHPPAQEVAQ